MSIGNPYIGYKNQGRNYNFFQQLTITAATYGLASATGQEPDIVMTCPTGGFSFYISGTGTNIVNYSFNGNTDDGNLIQQPSGVSYTQPRSYLQFDNRVASLVWFRIVSGSSATIYVEAWGHQ